MADTIYTGFESEPSEGYLQPDKVRVWFRCERCGHEYNKVYKAIPKKDAPCPEQACIDAIAAERAVKGMANAKGIIESRQAPGIAGLNMKNKLIDKVAADTMQDYGLTDLKDNLRIGDTMVPPLQDGLQKQADNFFSGGAKIAGKSVSALRQGAISGAYTDRSASSAFTPPRESTMPKAI